MQEEVSGYMDFFFYPWFNTFYIAFFIKIKILFFRTTGPISNQ